MNERIQELALKAKVKVWHNGGGLLSDKAFEIVAELIVRECADLVQDDDNAFDILKHFGIVE